MEIIVLSGGLGNQMFQYAFALAKKQAGGNVRLNTYSLTKEGTHNGYELGRLFGIEAEDSPSFALRLIRKLLIFQKKKYYKQLSTVLLRLLQLSGVKFVREKGYSEFNKEYLKPDTKKVFYFGFWQSPRYFTSIEEKLRKAFSFENLSLSKKSRSLLHSLQNSESISVHIRRGDYLSKGYKELYGDICTPDYYRKAISLIEKEVKDPLYIVFSDDPQWVKENFTIKNAVYVDWNSGRNSWEDMFLMSQCKNNIIANSTFSWWGAWLNTHPEKKVFAPAQFINNKKTPDIYPPEWIIVD